MKILALILIFGAVWFENSTALTCVQKDCEGDNCSKNSTECIHGKCNPDGSCKCNPCFAGRKCSDYNDEHHPSFLKKEETIFIEPHLKGLVYEAKARDEDNYKTCNPDQPCPCGESRYEIVGDSYGNDFFVINNDNGDLSLKPSSKLVAGDYYKVEIATSNYKEDFPYEQTSMSLDILTLHIRVRESNSVEDYLIKSEVHDIEKEKSKYLKDSNDKMAHLLDNHDDMEDLEDLEQLESPPQETKQTSGIRTETNIQAHSLKRHKRSSIGTDKGATNLSMTIDEAKSVYKDPVAPGNTIHFDLEIILPTIAAGSEMDMLVEIFVMDAVSGITTMALCDVIVEEVGTAIMMKDTNVLTKEIMNAERISLKTNDAFVNIHDRAILDFGEIYNEDSAGPAPYTLSTIKVSFKATLIPNALFTNDSILITAGTEFDLENYVWVSQAKAALNGNPGYSYQSDITLKGPDSVCLYSSGTFEIEAFISDPYETVVVEVFTPPGSSHDLFSVESLTIVSKGKNHKCIIEKDEYMFYKSITGRTNHKATITFPMMVCNVDTDDLAGEKTDVENKIVFVFNIFISGGAENDITTVGAGISIGTAKIWTCLMNITVCAPLTTAASAPAGVSAVALDTSTADPEAYQYSSIAWDIQVALTAPAAGAVTVVDIDCTATPGADAKICGVQYGRSGKYIGVFPDLSDIVVYDVDAKTAKWALTMNSSVISADQTRDSNQDYISFEVTVMYLTPAINPAKVLCTGASEVTLTGATGSAKIDDMSGVSSLLGADPLFYASSVAGLMATLTFRDLGYGKMVFETAGDFETKTYGAKVCRIDVLKVGRAVGCIAPMLNNEFLETKRTLKLAQDASLYEDGSETEFGEVCGSNIDADKAMAGDYEVQIRAIYQLPKAQTVVDADPYNISMGVLLDDNLIWTGWQDLTTELTLPTVVAAEDPTFVFLTPITTEEVFKPMMTKLHIKMHPGTIRNHKLTVTSADSSVLQICRVLIFNLGRNYACVDTEPLGKHLEPEQIVILKHDEADWGKEVTLDLGPIRNLGTGNIEASNIADQDSIEIVTIFKGVTAGTVDLSFIYDHGTAQAAVTVSAIITADVVQEGTAITMAVTGLDTTLDFYENVMKQVSVVLTVADPYDKPVYVKFEPLVPADATICFLAVTWAGLNVPCVIPSLVLTEDDGDAKKLLLDSICYYKLSENTTENEVHIRFGVMVKEGVAEAKVKVAIFENDVESATEEVTISKGSGDYVPMNYTVEDVKLHMLQNDTTSVIPGKQFYLGLYIEIPRGATIPVQLGIMTSSLEGHAYLTIHGFRWAAIQGKNVACPEEIDKYIVEFLQNSSTDGVEMVHTSQTDTLTSSLKYLTNTEVSYLQLNYQPGHNLALIEADLLIADHDKLANGDKMNVSFAIKVDTTIIVIEKELIMDRSGAPFEMLLESSLEFTDSTHDPTIAIPAGDALQLTARFKHKYNESQIEAYKAVVRIMLPSYMTVANASNTDRPALVTGITDDTYSSNITAELTVKEYLEFDIDYLFFTDNLELNFSITVDPHGLMAKGLGKLPSSAIMRLVCAQGDPAATLTYCGNTAFINYLVEGAECYDDLLINGFDDCNFVASTAIDTAVDAPMSKDAAGWSPAVRDISLWEHHISIDFLRKARITKIRFTEVSGSAKVDKFKLFSSNDGIVFIAACSGNEITASYDADPDALLSACRFEARYGRIQLISSLDNAAGEKKIGVSFKWFGCFVEEIPDPVNVCTFVAGSTPLTTSTDNWRHTALDTVTQIIYFCDYNPLKKRMVCYSSADGDTWNVLPSYIGSLKGYDSNFAMMYANDLKKKAVVASKDGVKWSLVDTTTVAALVVTDPTPIPGTDKAGFTDITIGGGWTASFDGLEKDGVAKVKWGSCCS